MIYALNISPETIGIGETLFIQFKSSEKIDCEKLEVQFWGVIHQKLRLWPKAENAVYMDKMAGNKYKLEIDLPDQPFFGFDIVHYTGPCQIKIIAHQNGTQKLLVEKFLQIGALKNLSSNTFPQIIPKPVKLFFQGEAHLLKFDKTPPGCYLKFKNAISKIDWRYFLPDFKITSQASANVLIGIDINNKTPDSIQAFSNKDEYYSLHSKLDASKKQLIIDIQARSEIGVKHAFRTLNQLISRDKNQLEIPLVNILDYPQFENRGVIEGFYGAPWSREERLEIIRFLGSVKCNSYIYAPKDDPYHRELWDKPYPKKELQALSELIAATKKESIDFVYSISPGGSICYCDESHVEKIITKLDELGAQGGRSFAILLDDIEEIGFVHKKDRLKFNDDWGLAHTYLTNRIYDTLTKKYGKVRLIYCPTEYYQDTDSPYRQAIAKELNPNIKVFWTGDGVFSKEITAEFSKKIKTFFNHPLVLWDNYPVNDANTNTLFLGPVMNRDPELYQVSPDFYSNPMIEANLSKFPIATMADYTWNPHAYDPQTSYLNTLSLLAPKELESVKAFTDTTLTSRIFKGGNSQISNLVSNWLICVGDKHGQTASLLIYLETSKQHAENLISSTFLTQFRQVEAYIVEWKNELEICIFCLQRFDSKHNQIILTHAEQVLFRGMYQSIDPMLISICDGRLIKLIEYFRENDN